MGANSKLNCLPHQNQQFKMIIVLAKFLFSCVLFSPAQLTIFPELFLSLLFSRLTTNSLQVRSQCYSTRPSLKRDPRTRPWFRHQHFTCPLPENIAGYLMWKYLRSVVMRCEDRSRVIFVASANVLL